MTLHQLKRRHMHWNETEENIKQLDIITEQNMTVDRIEQLEEQHETSGPFIETVLQKSERHFVASIDVERQKTLVIILGDDYE